VPRPALLLLLLAVAVACTSPPRSGPAPVVRAPQIRHLAAAIVLVEVTSRPRSQPPPPPSTASRGRCLAGFAALSGPDADPALCYRRLGGPMMITDAAISLIPGPTQGPWTLAITVPAGDLAALAGLLKRAVGHQLAVIVAGQAWSIPEVIKAPPLIDDQFDVLVATRQQADELLRILSHPS
jgi:hypothetical protein